MSKRRINKQQTARIQKIQADYRQKKDNEDSSSTEDGLVLSRFGRHAEIENEHGKCTHCSIRPNIDSLVAGDRVIWQAEGELQGVVLSRYPRHSMLGRPDKRGEFRPVAANISQIIVVVAVKPELSWPLLDSYLVMAESLGLKVCIVLNKADLSSEIIHQELIELYQPLAYPILLTSNQDKQSYEALKQTLNHHTSVFVGQSGVGKSSLIAGILPHENDIQTAEISAGSELGCHTTSNSRLYHLPSGGALIDSPGIREFGIWHLDEEQIKQGFVEFKDFYGNCRFRNCQHLSEPDCALKQAVADGKISERRLESLHRLLAESKSN